MPRIIDRTLDRLSQGTCFPAEPCSYASWLLFLTIQEADGWTLKPIDEEPSTWISLPICPGGQNSPIDTSAGSFQEGFALP